MKSKAGKKFIKKVKMKVPWVGHIIEDEKTAGDLNVSDGLVRLETYEGSLCLVCRGSRLLCGRVRCPALLRLYSFLKVKSLTASEKIRGSSPPGIFVGRIGYPFVYAGPLIPPILGDTSQFDTPEVWVGKSVEEIIGFRTNLIRGKFRVNVNRPKHNDRLIEKTLELALSSTSVDAEVVFKKKPANNFLIDETVQPMGPSALLKNIDVGNVKTDLRIEKAYSDRDLRAEEAVLKLYLDSVPVSGIQRAFSFGAFGLKKQRRLVPTRWSITAVDSIISRKLIEEKVKKRPAINDYRVYEFEYLGNIFIILLIPSTWRYEWIEAWHPGTAWNPGQRDVAMGGDWEGYKGRTKYASIGGCYYAVRLAVAEFLAREGRQAGVVAMREIHPSYVTPLGVWINRESVREALRRGCRKFSSLSESLDYIGRRFSIGLDEWVRASVLLKDEIYQERITDYLPRR
ncbi:MAG: Nre family DNA repair protein [Nitrososphaerota archaeon]|nr:Nre family DNA repair protein [Candidatus Bathyarchaeota archaeon]MDW8048610.1 Nre family DNA repair protein [Nitrososphaerota archaeon]